MATGPTVRPATDADLPFLTRHDRHVAPAVLREVVAQGRVLVVDDGEGPAGLLRWNLFWDELPFMNLLFVVGDRRGRGLGTALVRAWESAAEQAGHPAVLTSTQADEQAQHFYRRLGYRDCGALLFPGEPTELVLRKELPVSPLDSVPAP